MRIPLFFISLIFVSCSTPIYQHTTYHIDEFILDSCEISQGKQAILKLENQESQTCLPKCHFPCEEVLMEGDLLTIALYSLQRPDRVYAIERINKTIGFYVNDGKITLPELSPILVDGLTLKEAKQKVQEAYAQQLPDTKIYIDFKKKKERQVQIIGANRPVINIEEGMWLSEVLAQAKIPTSANLFKSYVMRDGKQLPIDLYKLLHEGDESQNVVMQGGDKIFIAAEADATVLVTGEVPHPICIPVSRGYISLQQALVMAGDIPYTGDKSYIHIIRGDFKRPKIYSLSWIDMMNVPSQPLLLMAGDVVVISEKPLTQWNRFITQLLPSAIGIENGFIVYQIYNAKN